MKPVKVIFNRPATIVFWDDGTKTVVKCNKRDKYDLEKGLLMAIVKKCCNDYGSVLALLDSYKSEFDSFESDREAIKDILGLTF